MGGYRRPEPQGDGKLNAALVLLLVVVAIGFATGLIRL